MNAQEMEKVIEAKAISESLERRIRKARAAGLVPSVSEVLMMARINRLVDELYQDFNRDADRQYQEEQNELARRDGMQYAIDDRKGVQ